MIWKDRIVERPMTFEVQNNPDGTITLEPAPGQIIQAGTPVNAANMNGIEENLLLANDIKGTVQYPEFIEGVISTIEHRNNDVVMRTDTFTFTDTLITEIRELFNGVRITFKYYFDSNGNYLMTEVN